MAKFYGKVGFSVTKEKENQPGVWIDEITEGEYYGDILDDYSQWNANTDVLDDCKITQRISIVADPYAYQNYTQIKYVEWMGVQWKVTKILIQRPRLILSIGGEYNG